MAGVSEADGFRIEAAVQFGFKWTNDDADEYACTEAALVAFAKSCERKGMADALKLVRITAQAGKDTKISAAPIALDVISGVLEHAIWKIDAELAPILEVERQRCLAAKPTISELCEDEGCPQHGTPHVCVDVAPFQHAQAAAAASKIFDYADLNLTMFDACCDEVPHMNRNE